MKNARRLGNLQTTTDFKLLQTANLPATACCASATPPVSWTDFFRRSFSRHVSGKIAAESCGKIPRKADQARLLPITKARPQGTDVLLHVVENYYTTPFMELFLQPRKHHDLPSAVNAVLAGELEGAGNCAGG